MKLLKPKIASQKHPAIYNLEVKLKYESGKIKSFFEIFNCQHLRKI